MGADLSAKRPVDPINLQRLDQRLRGQVRSHGLCVPPRFKKRPDRVGARLAREEGGTSGISPSPEPTPSRASSLLQILCPSPINGLPAISMWDLSAKRAVCPMKSCRLAHSLRGQARSYSDLRHVENPAPNPNTVESRVAHQFARSTKPWERTCPRRGRYIRYISIA